MTIPREVFEETILDFFSPVGEALRDPSVSEIMINGYDTIYIERAGKVEATPYEFPSKEALMSALRNLSQFVGRTFDEKNPILEARLPDGSRVEAIMPPASPDGPSVAIRRFFQEKLTVEKLIGFNAITEKSAHFLRAIVAAKKNIIVAGGTGSGKTSLLNVLSSFIPTDQRVVVIEDARELQLQLPHVVQLEAQAADPEGQGAVSIRDLFKATLRMRPDRIVVGEIRSGEALELIQAMTSGHGGCLSTVHATYPKDTLNRLETMAMMSDVEIPLRALQTQLASAIDFIVQTSRQQDGSRGITHIAEVKEYSDQDGYELHSIFEREFFGRDKNGQLKSRLEATGVTPECAPELAARGFELPPTTFQKD